MGQESFHAFENVIDPVVEPAWTGLAGGLTRIIRCNHDDADATAQRTGADEADYCQARAEAEARRAGEAAHPAARAAHLEMAALYQERELAARQVEDPAVQDWMNEGGSWLVDA